jgi:DNA-binding transcriptional LysR family regulator
MRFDIADLRLFLNVSERSSITLGASATHLSVASASERIKSMEMDLGTSLLVRGKTGVHPTAAGDALIKHARLILAQSDRMKGDLAEYSQGVRGRIRLLSNTAGLSEVLPVLVAKYLNEHPAIDLDVEERQSHEIVDAIRNGERDAGIVADFTPAGDLELLPLAVDQLVVVLPKDHLFATYKSVEFARLLSSQLIGLLGSNALTEHLEMQAAKLGSRIQWRVRVPNFLAICGMVSQGVGPAIISESAARRASKTMPVHIVKLVDPWARRKLSLCIQKGNSRPLYLEKFVSYVKREGRRAKKLESA